MIDRQERGRIPTKPHTIARDASGALLWEHCVTREGFDGAHAILYLPGPPQADKEAGATERGFARPVAAPDHPPLRRLLHAERCAPGGMVWESRVPLLFNDDVVVSVARPTASDDACFANLDGDDLIFVFEGRGHVESPFGRLNFDALDYLWLPRGVPTRVTLHSKDAFLFVIEARGGLHLPRQFRNDVGQLRMDAPYSHRDFRRPEWPLPSEATSGPQEVFAKRDDRFLRRVPVHHPLASAGWDGSIYPVAFPILNYQPRTGLVHLPPTIHATFAARGALVCSFVPRLVDFHPDAIPCPYPHSSVDCDEVIFYVRGNFTSRRGVGPGCVSLHPSSVPHGPHPGAYEASIGTTRTDELAVMLDTFKTLRPTVEASVLEESDYHASFTS